MLSKAVVARTVLAVTVCAQGRPLINCPHLIWQSIFCQTVVAIAACDQLTINAWPGEQLSVTEGEDLHRDGWRCSHGSLSLRGVAR